MEKCVTKEFANIAQKMREAQIQLLYRQTWTGLSGVLIVTLTACVALWQVVPQWKLSLWAGISVLLTVARGCIIFAFQQRAQLTSDINRWATLHVIGVIASGLMWAIPSIFLWPTEYSVYQLVWPIFILPLSAAAVATYYTWTLSYASFVILTVAPISVRFFFEGGLLLNILGCLSLFFVAVLLRAGRVMHTASLRASEFGIRNEALNIDLNKAIVAREQLNAQLHQEIAERILSEEKLSKRNQDLLRLNGELTSTKNNLELTNRKLEDAIANIRQLSGMLPICSFCKNIRNDQGYYEQIEEYIHKHSGVDFSHTVCPSCLIKHYPEVYERIVSEKNK